MFKSVRIIVTGIVQAVGFRPFIYRIAKKKNLNGFVRNIGNAVEISVSGEEEDINWFITEIKNDHPPLAEIDNVLVEEIDKKDFYEFRIVASKSKFLETASIIPSDTAICDDCLRELFDPNDRRYGYPFTVCTNCGPRFTIINGIPYDRKHTTMVEFRMCKPCRMEYTTPVDRRYHAEPIACWDCGPRVFLLNNKGAEVSQDIFEVTRLVDEGNIVAIKGMGGFHIACKTSDDEVVLRLRNRLRRREQPFAIMAKDFKAVKKFVEIDKIEKTEIETTNRPILVLNKREPFLLSEYVAPGLHTIGVMLPYSGLQNLLMKNTREHAWIMTSANFPGEPMITGKEEAIQKLNGVVDYYLVHNREIENRCDDSVIRFVDKKRTFLRRSRGFVPRQINLELEFPKVVGLGAELDVTISILKGKKCYLSQYIGDVSHFATLEFLKSALKHMMKITDIKDFDTVACDLHPDFNTTKYANELTKNVFQVQHHHSHIVSLMAEKNISDPIIGIACDGMGYGLDGIWGGEIILSSLDDFDRLASLSPYPMIGGDLATRYPSRVLLGILNDVVERSRIKRYFENVKYRGFKHGKKEFEICLRQLDNKINVFKATSMGRVLDSISALLNICLKRTYEGEPAMKLESYARKGEAKIKLPIEFQKINGVKYFDVGLILKEIFEDKSKPKDLAASAQKTLAEGLAILSSEFSDKYGFPVGMSGGVAYNESIVKIIKEYLEEEGLKFFTHTLVPPGDGGLALGQAVVAGAKISNELKPEIFYLS